MARAGLNILFFCTSAKPPTFLFRVWIFLLRSGLTRAHNSEFGLRFLENGAAPGGVYYSYSRSDPNYTRSDKNGGSRLFTSK